MMIAALIALGLVSMGRVGIDLFPRVEFPYVSVETRLEGAGPTTVETEITDSLEEEVVSISGIENLTSYAVSTASRSSMCFKLSQLRVFRAFDSLLSSASSTASTWATIFSSFTTVLPSLTVTDS